MAGKRHLGGALYAGPEQLHAGAVIAYQFVIAEQCIRKCDRNVGRYAQLLISPNVTEFRHA
jgi:hypothetical protein